MLDDKPNEPTTAFVSIPLARAQELREAETQRNALLKERDELRESLRWAAIWPCRREDDDDCQTHASEWPYPNEACEWATEARRLSKSEEQEGG